jgi:2-keto-3-deoxy-galactonokinase
MKPMSNTHEIITIDVERSATGLFTATSADLDGVFVAHRDLQAIVRDIPNIVQRWFKKRRNQDVTVFNGPITARDGGVRIPTIPVPAEIAAKAVSR